MAVYQDVSDDDQQFDQVMNEGEEYDDEESEADEEIEEIDIQRGAGKRARLEEAE